MSAMSAMDYLAERIAELAERTQERAESVDFMFGAVQTEKPLSVQVEQRLVLPEEMLHLTAAVVDLVAEEDDEGNVIYVPKHNLVVGERVLLARVRGGEAYVVLNRCYAMEVSE